MKEQPRFSLVVPCYNEGHSLEELVAKASYVAQSGRGEIILVDNGSSDDTAARLTELLGAPGVTSAVWWIKEDENRGYGGGILAGLQQATAPLVGWTHADLQTDVADVLRAVDLAGSRGADRAFVKGRRLGRPLFDRFFTAGMSLFESILLRAPLRDINAQPSVFSRGLMEEWVSPPLDFSLDLFALYSAHKLGYKISRLPVLFVPRRWGMSSWNTGMGAKWKFIKRTVRFSVEMKRRR